MFSEVLKIKPKVDGSDAVTMERTLNARFKNVSKKFGKGLFEAIKGGGIAGLAIGLIDKVLNPLEAVQSAIEKSLHAGDDLTTYAKQFNTTEGTLARIQAFAKASGLDPEGVRLLIEKFQSSVARSALDPSTPTATSKYVGKKDSAEAFFEFIQAMQKLTPIQQSLAQQEVFGERQILAASSFLGADFHKLNTIFAQAGAPTGAQQTSAAQFLGLRSNNKNTLDAILDQKDLVSKGRLINDNTIAGLAAKDELDRNQENKNLGKFESLEQISIANQKLINIAVNQFLKLAPVIADILPQVAEMLGGGVKAVEKSRALRGMAPGKDK